MYIPRIEQVHKNTGQVGQKPEKKKRIESTPSLSTVPESTPVWAVSSGPPAGALN